MTPESNLADRCLDCDQPLTGHFCAHCGQRADPAHKSLREFFSEFTEGLTNFDAKLWRTLPPLVRRPGLLTVEFNAGRRTRYVHPFRVYLFVTFVFFGLLAIFGQGAHLVQIEPSGGLTLDGNERRSWLDRMMVAAALKLRAAGNQQLAEQFAQHLPQVMFVVLPLAALLLKVAYGRRHFYIEHLVFVTHVHSFVFLLLALFVALPNLPTGLSGAIPTFAAAAYFGVALKRVYGQGVWTTLAKGAALASGYLLLVLLGLLATEALVVMTL